MAAGRSIAAGVGALALFLAASSTAASARVQVRDAVGAPSAGTASISGRVIGAGDSTGPIHRAIVTISAAELGVPRSVVSDDGGGFAFDRLPAGRYTITASRAAFVTTSYGSKRPGRPGTPIAIAEGQRVAGLTLTLTRGGVIAGTLRTAAGEPAPGVRVMATRVGDPPVRTLMAVASQPSDSTMTDDRGAYRIFGLAPGAYTVAAVPTTAPSAGERYRRSAAEIDAIFRELQTRTSGTPPATPPAPPPVFSVSPIYFPGTPSVAEAAAIPIAAGASRDDVDFVVDVVPSASVEGTVVRSGDLAGAPMTLVISGAGQATPLALAFAPRLAMTPGADGRFRYVNVTPGHYTITALARPTSADTRGAQPAVSMYWASAELDVNGQDLTGVSLTFQPALTLTGRLVFDAASLAPPPDLSGVQISLEPALGRGGSAVSNNTAYGGLQRSVFTRAARDGAFELDGLTPGPYRFVVRDAPALSGWWLRSVIVDRHDVLDDPLDIRPSHDLSNVVVTFTDRHTELGGVLQTPAAQPATDYVVVAIPASRALWRAERRVRSARPATDGRFAFADLPAGEYVVAALADVDPDDLKDSAVLEEVAAAGVRVTLADGERKQQDLRIRGVTPR